MLLSEFSCQFSNGGRLSHSVDSDHKYNGLSLLKFVSSLSHIHLLFDAVNQKLSAGSRFFDMLLFHFPAQILYNLRRSMYSKISHDQSLFQLLIKVLINFGKSVKNTVHSGYDIISCLCQT